MEGNWQDLDLSNKDICGALVQYPDTEGTVSDFSSLVQQAHKNGVGENA